MFVESSSIGRPSFLQLSKVTSRSEESKNAKTQPNDSRTNKKTKRKPTYDRLKVSTCLSYLPEIMTYEEALKKSRSWKKRIKEVLEKCLDKLVELGYLMEWHYGFSNGEVLSNEDMNEYLSKYYKWAELNIYFTPCRYWELLSTEKLAREKEKSLKELDKLYQ